MLSALLHRSQNQVVQRRRHVGVPSRELQLVARQRAATEDALLLEDALQQVVEVESVDRDTTVDATPSPSLGVLEDQLLLRHQTVEHLHDDVLVQRHRRAGTEGLLRPRVQDVRADRVAVRRRDAACESPSPSALTVDGDAAIAHVAAAAVRGLRARGRGAAHHAVFRARGRGAAHHAVFRGLRVKVKSYHHLRRGALVVRHDLHDGTLVRGHARDEHPRARVRHHLLHGVGVRDGVDARGGVEVNSALLQVIADLRGQGIVYCLDAPSLRTLHVCDVGDEERGGVRATAAAHAGDHLEVVANAVLEEVGLGAVVVDAVHNEVRMVVQELGEILLRHHGVERADVHRGIEVQNVLLHHLHLGTSNILPRGDGVTIQRGHRDHVEVDKGKVAHTRAGKHMRRVTTHTSQAHDGDVCIFNSLLSFFPEKGLVANKLLAVQFLFGNRYS